MITREIDFFEELEAKGIKITFIPENALSWMKLAWKLGYLAGSIDSIKAERTHLSKLKLIDHEVSNSIRSAHRIL